MRGALSEPFIPWARIFCLLSTFLLYLIHSSKMWLGYRNFFSLFQMIDGRFPAILHLPTIAELTG